MNLKNIFNFTRNKVTQYVVFDGDQTPSKVIQKIYKPDSTIKYDWVGVVSVPKVVTNIDVNVIKPTNFGKEATDTQIAISISDNLHKNKNIRTVCIVSDDGDFVDITLSLSKLFPNVNFYLASIRSTNCNKKKINNLNKNCFSVKIVL